ncbi:MAG: response regulator transcription factor [Tepidisphaeraceae bacterium]|jgi:DNA-binding NarL/FixJ family response regulator
MNPRIVVVEDHALVRSGIRSLLEESSQVTVVGEAPDGRRALELCDELSPDMVLTDIEMRELNGIETTRQIHAAHPEIKVIVVSMYSEGQYVREALRAGASGYVLKHDAFTELLTAIRAVAAGKRYLSAQLSDLVLDDYARRGDGTQPANALDKLSAREREILQLVAEGHSSPQIAATLHISIRTVDAHRASVMQKLSMHSIASLTKFAIANGLTSLH